MAPNSRSKSNADASSSSQFPTPILDDDDFRDYPSPSFLTASKTSSHPPPLKPRNIATSRHSKKPKIQKSVSRGKENCFFDETELDLGSGLDSIEPTLDILKPKGVNDNSIATNLVLSESFEPIEEEEELNADEELFEPIEEEEEVNADEELSEGTSELDVLLKLCDGEDEQGFYDDSVGKCAVTISCPLCGADISELSDDRKQIHTNECLDLVEGQTDVAASNEETEANQCPGQVLDGSPLQSAKKDVNVSPVVEWLRNLGLGKYEEIFVRQEIDLGAIQWLTDEDLCSIGITSLGPRKKILHAIRELRRELSRRVEQQTDVEQKMDVSKTVADETKLGTNKLITDYFLGPPSERKRCVIPTIGQTSARRSQASTTNRSIGRKDMSRNGKQKDVPSWCSIPGTPFRVDAFKYLRRDCSHWFLSHFHLDLTFFEKKQPCYLVQSGIYSLFLCLTCMNYGEDKITSIFAINYQGLTRSFSHGMIYCSSITAKLVNLKIGIPWDKMQVLPLNQKINIAGTDVTCFDANHCPGAIVILFEPPNGKPVLHTGDFRFCEEMKELSFLQAFPIHTLILDTTYCNAKYDFPKQETVIQFVIDAIQAESFNPKTLFLIGSYTIGKERVFLEVARALRKKIYVTAAKLRILKCLDFQQEDMQWFTTNEHESHIHVVPMWSIASFKRLKHISNQYMGRYSLIVTISPTGWSFGKGKKSSGRWQKGTIIRYEVPYSEHSSFTELKEFVRFISPSKIIPSVNNHGPDSQESMVSLLLS